MPTNLRKTLWVWQKKLVNRTPAPVAVVVAGLWKKPWCWQQCNEITKCIKANAETQTAILDLISNSPQVCAATISCVSAWLGNSWVDPVVASEICAYLWWLSQNSSPVSGDKIVLGSCEYATIEDVLWNNTTVELALDANNDLIVTVNDVSSTPIDISIDCSKVVDCVEAEPALVLNNVTTDDLNVTWTLTLPAWSVTHTVVGNTSTVTVGGISSTANVVTSNSVSLTWTVLTSSVNWVTDTADLADLLNSATFQSNDDQVLTAAATSDFAITLTPTTVTDPDSQVNKVNYELSATAKPTVICSGNALSPTNKLLTTDTLTTNVTAPVTVVATPDDTNAINQFVKSVKVNTWCSEDIYSPVISNKIVRNTLSSPTITQFTITPTQVNIWWKDIYRATLVWTDTAPTNPLWAWYFYTWKSQWQYEIDMPNVEWTSYSFLQWTWATFVPEQEWWYSITNKTQEMHTLSVDWYIAAWWTVTLTQRFDIKVDTWQSLQTAWAVLPQLQFTAWEIIYHPEF